MGEAGDGIGDILTGGLVARTVEGGGGVADHGDREGAGGLCLNCGAARAGAFCQGCGQSGHVHRNVTALGHDILHGVFHFEGKIWKTLPMLALHPGELTRRYVHGERAKFVSPMALFLFSVFLLFAAVNWVSGPDKASVPQGLARVKEQIAQDIEKAGDKLDTLREKRTDKLGDDPKANVADLDRKIADIQGEVGALKLAAGRMPANAEAAARAGPIEAGGHTYQFDVATGVKGMDFDTGIPGLDRQIAHVKENPELYAYKLKMASYKFSWALIPISVPFIWLMFFWRRDVGLYDHAVFAIHSLSFMSLFAVMLVGLYMLGVGEAWLWLAFLIVPPIHIYRQLRGAYQLGRFGGLWRMVTLIGMTAVTSLLFFMLLLWLEAE
jgi:hypothetical protein